jgi:hypothetical protein
VRWCWWWRWWVRIFSFSSFLWKVNRNNKIKFESEIEKDSSDICWWKTKLNFHLSASQTFPPPLNDSSQHPFYISHWNNVEWLNIAKGQHYIFVINHRNSFPINFPTTTGWTFFLYVEHLLIHSNIFGLNWFKCNFNFVSFAKKFNSFNLQIINDVNTLRVSPLIKVINPQPNVNPRDSAIFSDH